MKKLKLIILSFVLFLLTKLEVVAQCAMCRGSVESQVSAGDTSVAANLNFGILYLFFTPYMIVRVTALLWYRASKRNGKKIQASSNLTGQKPAM